MEAVIAPRFYLFTKRTLHSYDDFIQDIFTRNLEKPVANAKQELY